MAGLLAVLAGAAAGIGTSGVAVLLASVFAIPLFLWPIGGTLATLALRPVIDCFWNQRFVEIGSQMVNLQSVVGVVVPVAAWGVILSGRDLSRTRPVELWLLAYALVSFLGVLLSPVGYPAMADFARVALPIAFYWIGKRAALASEKLHTSAWVLASYGLIPLLGAALQLLGMIRPATGALQSPLDVMRVTGFYHHPLDITMRAGIALPFALALATAYGTPAQRISMTVWAGFLALTSWAPLVRSALVATLVELSGFLYFMRRRALAWTLVLAACGGAWILPPTRAVLLEAVRPLTTGSYYELATGRAVLFAAQVAAFQQAPLPQKILGRGLHSTPGVNRQFAPLALAETGTPDLEEGNIGAHNQYLRVLTECGIVGLLVFAGLIAACMRDAARAMRRSARTIDRTLGAAVLLLLIAISIYGLSGTPLDLPSIAWPVWFAAGLAGGIAARLPSGGEPERAEAA